MEMIIGLVVLIFSAILHEVMHGFVADKLGDSTARYAGRLTLNPIPHIDPIMSVLLPALLLLSGSPIIFGAAKPVPVNALNLKDGEKDMALVALAGPLTNMVIAGIAAVLFNIIQIDTVQAILYIVVLYNLVLGFLNLIPIPPLDGSRFVTYILPGDIGRSYDSISSFGIFILFFLLFFPIGGFRLGDLLQQLIFATMSLFGLPILF